MKRIKRRETAVLARKALLVVGLWGVAAMFMALFWVRESDLAAARDEAAREKFPAPDSTPPVMPTITRKDFEFRLPVPGERGKYEWKVSGRKTVPVNPTTDRLFDFEGEMVNRGDLIKLSSPTALFDRERRVLSSRDGVVLQSEWSKTEAAEMVMDMKTNSTRFSGGVTTEIDREEAAKREVVSVPPPGGGKGSPPEAATDKPKEKKKRSPLIIKSQRLDVDLDKNRAVYTGKVMAKDDSGIIHADKMEAENYSKEETEKNPKLKGVKTVTCTGNVVINQVAAKKQSLCTRAVYDAKTNIIHLYGDPKTGKKVVYRDEDAMRQVTAVELIFDRNKNKIIFDKDVEVIDYNPDTKGFLGFMEPGGTQPPTLPKSASGAEKKSPPSPK